MASAAIDGSFRVDDVRAGKYVLRIRFAGRSPGPLSEYRFTVPAVEGNRSSEPLDLGEVKLKKT